MRRLAGCSLTLLLITVFLVLVIRGPGLRTLPVPIDLTLLLDAAAGEVDIVTGRRPATPESTQAPSPTASSPALAPTHTVVTTPSAPVAESAGVRLTAAVRSSAGASLDTVVDGNAIVLAARVVNATRQRVTGPVYFSLERSGAGGVSIGQCAVEVAPGDEASCTTQVAANGWAWQDTQRVERRTVYATLRRYGASAAVDVRVRPKPVVLVHGFTSNAATWSAWTDPDGFLADWNMSGYAVGDGQFAVEPMDTGDFTQPRRPTKTLAENAEIVARYVDAVRRATNADRVDLVAHSMGGLISRYYVSHFMPTVDRPGLPAVSAVNQLYMIGTPNAGTSCAIPPATLGLYPPATLQLTPNYVRYLFNPRTNDARGVPFFILAGDPIQDYAALVCTPVPTDVFVSVASAAGTIPVTAEIKAVRHGEQTKSPVVFETVRESLSRDPSQYPIPMPTAPTVSPVPGDDLQVSLVGSGRLSEGRLATVSVPVDAAASVSFLLYAPGKDVEMSLLSSSGRPITPETAQTVPDVSVETADGRGLTATQSIGIRKPEPGRWQLVLTPRTGAPADGAFYAVAAFLQSDLRLSVKTPSPVVPAGQAVSIRATLTGPVVPDTLTLTGTIRNAQGEIVGETELLDNGTHGDEAAGDGEFGATWVPARAGVYSITVTASGENAAGNSFQRLGNLAVEVGS